MLKAAKMQKIEDAGPLPKDLKEAEQCCQQNNQFKYQATDLCHAVHQWGGHMELSKFDKELRSRWNSAVTAGHFRYKLDNMESRVIPGKYGLVAQLNENRFTQRRKAEVMTRVCQPFDPLRFNFNKIASKEVLFEMCPEDNKSKDSHHLLVINVSPVEYGSSLLVPFVQSCLPQVLTLESIQLALEVSLLSSHRGFHVGFNSLCAFASINHLHFHVWYMEYPSCLESITVTPIGENFFETQDFPTRALVFELRDLDVSSIARKIHTAASYFISNEVAHNMHIVRGDSCSPRTNGCRDDNPVLRVFLWPRKQAIGSKDEGVWDRPMAVCEFAGQLMMESREAFNDYTEELFCKDLGKATLEREKFEQHKRAISDMLSE